MSDATKKCKYCGREIGIDTNFCWYCGRELEARPERPDVQSPASRPNRRLLLALAIAAVIILAIVLLLPLLH